MTWLEIYDFSYMESEEEFETMYFDNIENTIEGIKLRFQLSKIKFVNQGVSQDANGDLLKLKGCD